MINGLLIKMLHRISENDVMCAFIIEAASYSVLSHKLEAKLDYRLLPGRLGALDHYTYIVHGPYQPKRPFLAI
ncbi:unnamed protein product, partial [Dovyalis caffra]